ncbi:acetoacetate--CoA ligase [Pseudolysinimonas yzui]|uniref:Acetoacetyl-CoA synthetase n=1 Tax=Pseudolysinimonas yzui TaxID=2708254 RepID=A0A8J3M5W8_9MICO|nr:acetoacetate--CoA ligase [Pseudolysinimonas yzui]GHF23674.1 acetoacetyl-CoA synthetase [Pseudolysinimonas yzui]
MAAVAAPEVTWAPTEESMRATSLWSFRELAARRYGVEANDYAELWRWSVDEPGEFWDVVREHAGIIGDGLTGPALAERRMPGAVWYPNARLNYSENVLRWARTQPDQTAIVGLDEDGGRVEYTWAGLEAATAALAARLRELGVGPGDVVAAVLPNIPQALVGLLATASIGAIWSVCSPDFAEQAIIDRLAPLAPIVLLGASGYTFKGASIDARPRVAAVAAALPGSPVVEYVDDLSRLPSAPATYTRVTFEHPLWVLFSSGTTGAPKGIVHGHGGILLEAAKGIGLQFDLGPGDRYFTAANTSWMVWNTLANSLAVGASVVTYPGSSNWPDVDRQFALVAESRATMLATGAAYLALVEDAGLRPGERHDLSRLHTIMSTGSVLAPSTWRWVHDAVKADVHLSSDSGGTDVCGGLIGGNPWQPVHLGELQGPTLGVPVQVRAADGTEAPAGEVGELVLTGPLPSMPVAFWNDPDGALYRAAYFADDPAVWTHGDWISRTPRGGFVVHGRSDATLNRDGVRLGSAEIYAALQSIPEVVNSVVLGLETPGGGYWMPLFVQLADGADLDDELVTRIRSTIRARATARHVPDAIEAVPGIPTTHTGKRIEVPLKKLFVGQNPDTAVTRGSLANPEAVDWFVERARVFRAENGRERT